MATSAPPHTSRGEWNDSKSDSNEMGEMSTKSIEFGMAGLDLVGMSSGSRPPALSGSSASTGGEHSRQHSFSSFPGSLDPVGGHRGSPPDSPLHRTQQHTSSTNGQGGSRPPGLSIPSPIGKSAGSGNNTASSSPMLSVSPNSYVDGNLEHMGLGRQQNFLFGDAGSIHSLPLDVGGDSGRYPNHGISPWGDLTQPPRPVSDAGSWTSGGIPAGHSFDNADLDDDGLHGLGALRDRAYSSPGPVMTHKGQISSSPPVGEMYPNYKAMSPVYSEDHSGSRGFPTDPRRPRAVTRETSKSGSRPPRSGGHYGDSSFSSQQGDRSYSSSGGLSTSYSHDGITDMGSGYAPLDSGSRGRSTSLGTMSPQAGDYRKMSNESYMPPPSSQIDHSQKFGSLPNLGSYVQQQRMPGGLSPQQPQYSSQGGMGHVRSYSDPRLVQQIQGYGSSHEFREDQYGMFRVEGESIRSGSNLSSDMRFVQQSNLSRSISAGPALQQHGRSSTMSHISLSGGDGYDYEDPHMMARRHTIQPSGSFGSQPQLQRREGLDYSERLPQVLATPEEMRMYGVPVQYDRGPGQPIHSRAHSDGGALFSAAGPTNQGQSVQLSSSLDDDFAHPLVGEHIADFDDEEVSGSSYAGVMSSIPPHYSDDNHPLRHHPARHSFTAGMTPMERQLPALAPAPKVVYTVKFKRTQRNFITGPRVTRDLDIGCYVKVEADRGEDLGIIVSKIQNGKVSGSGRGSSRDLGTLPGMGIPSTADLKRIIRVATHDEVSLLAVKRQEEEELLNICRTKVRQRALPMKVIDAEYQFDRHKLTFFFEAEGRIDFRELVRDLFSMYKTRIWMQQLDKTPALTTAGGIEYGTSPPEHIESMENLGRPGMSN